jgi:hypothetical protein
MNSNKISNKVLLLLSTIYAILIFLTGIFLKKSGMFDDDKLKVSDFLAAAFAVASIFIGVVAAVLSYKTLQFAQKAEEGQLYIKMMERYSSEEMLDSLQKLSAFWSLNQNDLEPALKKWRLALLASDANAIIIDLARHRVKYFYRDLMQLYQAGYFSRDLTKRILNPGGRHLFNNLVLPMENHRNQHLFDGEYSPFNEFNDELNIEQQIRTN